MKYIILFIVTWAIIFFVGNSRVDNGYDYIPSKYNWKTALISLITTAIVFGLAFIIKK